MKPFPFVWPWALLFWGVFWWAYWPEFRIIRNAQKSQGKTDAKSLQVILAAGSVAMFAAFPVAWMPAFQLQAFRMGWFIAGTGLVLVASLLRRHCFRMLGASFTGDVRANKDQVIVTRGAYHYVRHPSYTAGILLMTGVGLALGSLLSALLGFAGSLVGYVYRMNVEEKALLAAIGQPYAEFMRTRKRLVPYLY